MKNIIYCLLFCVGLICSSNSYGQTLDRNNLENKIDALIPTQLYSANEIRSGKVTLTINRLSAENYQPKLEYEGEVFTCFGDDTKPISIKIGTGASETWYHGNYYQVTNVDGSLKCVGRVSTTNGSIFDVEDIYAIYEGDAIKMARNVNVLAANDRDNCFSTSYGFDDGTNTEMTDYDFFSPGLWYGDNQNRPKHSLAYFYTDNYFYFREDRLPLPVIAGRKKSNNTTITLVHTDAVTTTYSGENGVNNIIDWRIQFGSIGVRHFDKTSFVYNFPGSEGERTYIQGRAGNANGKRWSYRSHPVATSGVDHSYNLVVSFSKTKDVASVVKEGWRTAYSHYNPEIVETDINTVYDLQLDLLRQYYKNVQGFPGWPFGIWLNTNSSKEKVAGEARNYNYNMGFIGMQLPLGAFLLKEALDSETTGLRDSMVALVDAWATKSLTNTGLPKTWADPPNSWRERYNTTMRTACGGMEGATMAYSFAKAGGIDKPNWLQYAKDFGNWLVSHQNTDGSYYLSYAWTGSQNPTNTTKLSSVNPIRFLLELYLVTNDERYLNTAIKAGEFCYNEVHEKYQYVGSVIDNPNVLDRESGQMTLYAFLTLYDVTQDNKWLDAAVQVAEYTETWMYAWDIPPVTGLSPVSYPLSKNGTGLTIIATGHSACDNGFSFSAFQYYRLYLYTGDTHFLDVAKCNYYNGKQTMDWDGSIGYTHRGLQTEAQQIRGKSVGSWLPWVSAANLDPMVRFKLAFGDLDINNIEANNTLEELQELNLKYSITRGLAAAPFRAVKQYVPVENSATLFDIEVDNPDNTILNFTLKTQPKNGTITGNTPDNLTYTKGSGFSYKDSVTYEITGNGYSRNVTVVFTDEF